MDLDGLKKKLNLIKQRFSKKPDEGQSIPANWVPELIKKETTDIQEDGTVKVVYEVKKTKWFIARRVKRFICFILIVVNFIMLVTCFFVKGGIMSPFFFFNTVFLADYFWQSRPQPLEEYR